MISMPTAHNGITAIMNAPNDSSTSVSRMRRSTTAEQIKHLILRRGLHPGDAIPTETELCQELDVSRSSVREAIRTLSTLDIVEVRHGHGTVVGRMSLAPLVETLVFRGVLSPGDDLAALREVIELRCALDLALADRVLGAHFGKPNKSLKRLADQMRTKAEQGRTFVQEDRQFHAELLAPIGNRLAGQLVTAFWDIHAAVLPRLGLALPADILRTAIAHGAILDAALSGNLEALRKATITHYEPLLTMIEAVERQKD